MRESSVNERQSSAAEDYLQHNPELSETRLAYLLTADKLLELDQERRISFVDIVVHQPADEVLGKLQQIRIGADLLSEDDTQLAIESDGKYFPVLNITKEQSKLVGAGVRAWGWGSGQGASRNLELELFYHQNTEHFTEVVSLSGNVAGSVSATGYIVMPEYAEQGYEGHNFTTIYDLTDEDVADFIDVVNEVVGDNPESYAMRQKRLLRSVMDAAATAEARDAMQAVVDRTWPAQALYVLTDKQGDTNVSIAELAANAETVDEAVQAIDRFLSEWNFPSLQ